MYVNTEMQNFSNVLKIVTMPAIRRKRRGGGEAGTGGVLYKNYIFLKNLQKS